MTTADETVAPSPATPDASNGATAAPNGAPATTVAAVDPHSRVTTDSPVDPEAPNDSDSEEIQELKRKLHEARRDADKKRRARNETMERAGEFEGLYNEARQELGTAQQQLESATETIKTREAELKKVRAELEGYRSSLVERFEESDREIAATSDLSKLPALFERLYGRTLLSQTAPPSPGSGKPTAARPNTNWRDLPPSEQIKLGLQR